MAEEGQAVAEELRRAWPAAAAQMYSMLGGSLVERCEHVKGVGQLEQSRALAVESGDREVLGEVFECLGNYHRGLGEYMKAIEEYEQARAIAVELGHRQKEGTECNNCLLYTSPSPRDVEEPRMPSSA